MSNIMREEIMIKRLGVYFVGLFTAWIVQAFAQETLIP
jgi:hypothetical protein